MKKYKARNIFSGSSRLAEPNGLVILDNDRVLVSDGAKACVHEFEENGEYVGEFCKFKELKCPTGTCMLSDAMISRDFVPNAACHC